MSVPQRCRGGAEVLTLPLPSIISLLYLPFNIVHLLIWPDTGTRRVWAFAFSLLKVFTFPINFTIIFTSSLNSLSRWRTEVNSCTDLLVTRTGFKAV
jgi:hypothetical protein